MDMYTFLNSNLFQALIILLTGSVALIMYRITKYNEKKEAARIIINEIRTAEKAVQEIKNKRHVSELSFILPSNTWQYKKHLFLHKLDEDELNLVNEFYYKCSYAEHYIQMIFKELKLINMANNESWIFSPDTPTMSVIEYIENILFVTSASAGIKLKKIAK